MRQCRRKSRKRTFAFGPFVFWPASRGRGARRYQSVVDDSPESFLAFRARTMSLLALIAARGGLGAPEVVATAVVFVMVLAQARSFRREDIRLERGGLDRNDVRILIGLVVLLALLGAVLVYGRWAS